MQFVNDGWLRKAQEYDKFCHAGGSCLMVCLLWAAIKRVEIWNLSSQSRLFIVGVLILSGGVALEIVQAYRGIGFSWRDVVADLAGVLVAYRAIGG